MIHFSKEQEQAVQHGNHPMIVVAGPGSGKTTVLTHRVRFLIDTHGVKPEDILVITFTKAAAVEMQSRFEQIVGKKMPVTFGTFHSVFFRILKAAYNYSVDNIIREDYRKQLLMDAVARSHMEPEDGGDFYQQLAGEISRVKGEGLDIQVYHSARFPSTEFQNVYRYYCEALTRARMIDFDDMLLMTKELFEARQDILAAWQRRYRYILIDEFQDINRIQYEVIRKLALPENNLFIVGDDDQSIYGFRGSKPEIMLRFEEDYPDARKVILDTNYRSSANIVTAAGHLIAHNSVRFAKNIRTTNEQGETVDIVEFADHKLEYERVMEEIVGRVKQSVEPAAHYADFAILYRTNAIAEPIVRKLMEMNIPFVLKEGIPNLFDHWIAKDFIAYMTLALGGRDRGDFLRIVNKPVRYIGRDYLTDSQIDLDELEKYYEEKPWMMDRVRKMKADLRQMGSMNPYGAMNFLRKGVGYDDYLKEYASERGLDEQELLDVAEELMETARGRRSIADWFDYIGDYTRELQETNRRTLGEKKNLDAVTLTTMHSAKGLEYDTVFVLDVNEGIAPHKKSVFSEQVEEERRMFYVAMTRAKRMLHIYYSKLRYNRKLEPSRFLEEIMGKE